MTQSIRRAAVIGSGVMGGAIAALIAGAGIPVHLLDIAPNQLTPDEEKKGLTLSHPAVKNRIINAGMQALKKSRPAALFTPQIMNSITPGNLEDNFNVLGEVDWVVEVIVENLAVKRQLMARIDKVRKPDSIISSNTSGIPIAAIAAECSPSFKAHFLGTHFFNPPRYLKLLEVIPTADTLPEVLNFVVDLGERVLGKGVVLCKDRPSFIGNRLAAFNLNHILRYAIDNGYTVEEVDALTGPMIGRPNTASFRLFDLVGVDVMCHVSDNLYKDAPEDECREEINPPQILRELFNRGWLGDKKGQGFFRTVRNADKKEIFAIDLKTLEYRPTEPAKLEGLDGIKAIGPLSEKLKALVSDQGRVGKFSWATLSRYLAYAGMRVPEITDDLYNVDNAMKWGYSHQMGPFEMWDALGVAETVKRMETSGVGVAPWIKEMLAGGNKTFYKRENGKVFAYDLAKKGYKEISRKAECVSIADLKEGRKEIKSNPGASLVDMGDGVLLLEFHSKMNVLNDDVTAMLEEAVKVAESSYDALVIGNQGRAFCAGADLSFILNACEQGNFDQIDSTLKRLQNATMALRFCMKPVVAAPFAMTLGGGAEISMASSRIVAAAETYMGQVEVGIGLLPAAGGCKELVRRLVSPAVLTAPGLDAIPFLQKVFNMISMGKTSGSGEDAREMGFLTNSDVVVMNQDRLLGEAKREALALAAKGYRPPTHTKTIFALGYRGIQGLLYGLLQMSEGRFISEYDAKLAKKIAYVVSGGDLSKPQWVDEQYMLDLEREAFLSLCGEQLTQDRIRHMLRVGKPLRN